MRVAFAAWISFLALVVLGCDSGTGTAAPQPSPVSIPVERSTVSLSVGPAGGTIQHASGGSLVVPEGALAEPTILTLTGADAPDPDDTGAVSVGQALEAGPEGITFLKPVELRLHFDPTRLPQQRSVSDVRVRMAPHGSHQFSTLSSTVDATTQTVVASTYHFTTFVPAAEEDPIFITTTSPLPHATVGAAYTTTFAATGGTGPYAWSVSSGSALPPGLVLSTAGELSGTPTASGNYSFFVSVTAGRSAVQAAFALTAEPQTNPIPTLTAITPTWAPIGGPSATMVATGSDFVPSSVLRFDATILPTAFVSATELSASMPSWLLQGGDHVVTVSSPGPGGGTSATKSFTVSAPNPVPSVTSLIPSTLAVEGASGSVDLVGSGFVPASSVEIDGTVVPSIYNATTDLTATVSAGTLAAPGTHSVRVRNPAPAGGLSNAVTLEVHAADPPTISSVQPSPLLVAGTSAQVTVTGSRFDATTLVTIDNQSLATLYVSPSKLVATVPASYLTSPRQLTFYVDTPPPGGGFSLAAVSVNVAAPATCEGVDLNTNPANCGACGHDCLGGSCVAGKCQSVILATRTTQLMWMATDANNVYWAGHTPELGPTGEVAYCAKTGCGGIPTVLATNQYTPSQLVVDSTTVYWTNQWSAVDTIGSVASCPIAGCGGSPTYQATNEVEPRNIALWGDSLFWTSSRAPYMVRRCSLAGGCDATKSTIDGSVQPTGLVANNTWLYSWDLGAQKIERCQYGLPPAAGGCGSTPMTVSPTIARMYSENIALDASNVYWIEYAQTVKQCPVDGCVKPITLWAKEDAGPVTLAVDRTDVYFTADETPSSIRKCAIGGCGGAPTTVLDNLPFVTDLRVDDTAIYWISADDKTIRKLAK